MYYPFQKKGICIIAGLFFINLLCCSCAHYRAVALYEIRDHESQKNKTVLYAIAKNNIIVPEFVIDKNGFYPQSKDEAWSRFHKRKERVEPEINEKYNIPQTIPYQMKRIGLMIGLIAVAPVVIPITYISNITMNNAEKKEQSGFWQTVKEYFSISVNEPLSYHPPLKDEFKIVNIYN